VFRSVRHRAAAQDLYAAIVAQARQPAFYSGLGVPDTVDGRFEMIALHAFLVLHRLKGTDAGAELGQAVFDAMFADMDRNLREMGVGDLSVGPRVKSMAEGFYGRVAAYDAGLQQADDGTLLEALRRNVYGTLKDASSAPGTAVQTLARYVRACAASLAAQDIAELSRGQPRFATPASGDPVH
jgi:cytochrome b pre-mRNA-processing protein 3